MCPHSRAWASGVLVTHSSLSGLLVYRRLADWIKLLLDLLQNPVGVIAGDEGDVFVGLQFIQ